MSRMDGALKPRDVDWAIPPSHWYAVQTRARHEKQVSEQLRSRQVEAFLPLYHSQRRWRNRCRVCLELPLFPGYLFVRIGSHERLQVLQVPSVVSIVSNGRELLAVPDREIEGLRCGLALRNAEPHAYLPIGQRARIIAGPMSGLEGVVVRKKNGLRVVLTVELIMKSVAVEVDDDELEPVAAPLRQFQPQMVVA